MKAVFADTFYYLALVNEADEAHRRAVEISRTLRVPFLTTAWVITELADAMAKARQRGAFLALLASIETDPGITVLDPDKALYEAGLALYARRPDKDWSLTDCISFVAMKQWRLTDALTADRHFQQAGYNALLLQKDEM